MTLHLVLNKLSENANSIKNGFRGNDFMILEDNDEMKGYLKTKSEHNFIEAVNEFIEYHKNNNRIDPFHIAQLIEVLVSVQPAVYAYRARMYWNTTDYASEFSPITGSCTRIFNIIREELMRMSPEQKEEIKKYLRPDTLLTKITHFFWENDNQHNSKIIKIIDLVSLIPHNKI